MIYLRFLLFIIIAALMVNEGATLKCWACQSNDPVAAGCADPFLGSAEVKDDHLFIRECEKKQTHLQLLPNGTIHTQSIGRGLVPFCLKMTYKTLGMIQIMRICASGLPNTTEGSCMYAEPQKETGGNVIACDACASDLCNRAARVRALATLVAPLLLLLT